MNRRVFSEISLDNAQLFDDVAYFRFCLEEKWLLLRPLDFCLNFVHINNLLFKLRTSLIGVVLTILISFIENSPKKIVIFCNSDNFLTDRI